MWSFHFLNYGVELEEISIRIFSLSMKTTKLFQNPFSNQRCQNCGRPFDPTRERCPKCGTPNPEIGRSAGFSKMTPLGPGKEIEVFLTGWAGLQLIFIVIELVAILIASGAIEAAGFSGASLSEGLKAYQSSSSFLAIVNYGGYAILLIFILTLLGKDINRLFATFKHPETYYGFLFGVGAIVISALWSVISSKLGATTNQNQTAVVKIVTETPFFAILITGIVAPFTEEIAYRVGLFGFSKRINIYLAYFIGSVVFGLIHMHDFGSVNEWLSFPDYVLAGLLFSFCYDKFGFGASLLAHITNNMFALIQVLIVYNS